MKKLLLLLIALIFTASVFTPAALANSAEPPCLTIVVTNPPQDMTISIRFADQTVAEVGPLTKEQKAWEAYYRYFYGTTFSTRSPLEGATLIIASSETNFECPLPAMAFAQYNNLLTLDLASKRVINGEAAGRSISLIALRVFLTLLIEGLIFFAFGYRKKASWIAFFAINLVTQGTLNFALSGSDIGPYWVIGFVIIELLIFIVEAFAFAFIVREKKRSRAVLYSLAANLASLVLGGILLAYLPM